MATNWKNLGRLGHANRVLGDDDANNDFASTSVVANADGSVLERIEYVQANMALASAATTLATDILAIPRCVEKLSGAVHTTADPLFTISGGPVRCTIYGIVTTTIQAGASSIKLTLTTTSPAATVDMSAGAVDIDGDVAGTSYRHINTTAVLTPVTAGFVMMGNAFATSDTEFFCPAGTVNCISTAISTGAIAWYMMYTPLSENSRVVAAA